MNRRDIRSLAVFLVLSFGLSWLVALPLWLGDGLLSPWFPIVSIAMMFTPALASLIVVFTIDKPANKARALGIWPLKPVGRFILYLALGLVVPVLLVLIALPIGAVLGVYPADFTHFSGFQALMDAQLGAAGISEIGLPIGVLVAMQMLNIPIGALINLIPALGEELGWRGWLLPKLMQLGALPAILISGVIWGLWHAPLILLGYNYAEAPGWLALSMMTGMTILIGAVFAWLRLRSESVWPAALAHGAFNAAGGTFILFAQAGRTIDTTQATILGWSGWIVPLILVIVLYLAGQFKPSAQSPVASTVTKPST